MRGRWPCNATIIAVCLNKLCNLQHVTEPFAGDYLTLIDCAKFVVRRVGQHITKRSYFDFAIRILEYVDVFSNESTVSWDVRK